MPRYFATWNLAEGSLQAFALRTGITQSNATVRVHRARQPSKAAHPRLRHLLDGRLSQLPPRRNEAILNAVAEDLSFAFSRCASTAKQ
jgi:hypothetical protein